MAVRTGVISAVLACAMAAGAAAQDRTGAAIAAAADEFLSTLDAGQRAAAMFAFDDAAQRANWSNLPEPIYQRAGVRWGDLDEGQRAALTGLLGAILSPDGVRMVQEQMLADDVLAEERAAGGGGPGGPGGGPQFGSDYYFVSFLGEPSESEPWALQFGGHHLAINAAVAGSELSLSPLLTGGQPLMFSRDGRGIYIIEDEVNASVEMLGGLTDDQIAQAVRSEQRSDMALGPGRDGMVLQPEGLAGAAMTPEQKAQFLALIESRLGIINAEDLEATMAPIRDTLDDTWLAWFGPVDAPGAAYFRIVGPRVMIEFSPQGLGGDPLQHAHNMYRDPANEYGAAWAD